MSATNPYMNPPRFRYRSRQGGGAAVEFAIVAMLFFTIVFGIIEFARAMYMVNTMAEVTRSAAHAAANISFNDTNALDAARKRAVFDEKDGILPLGNPITYKNIRIEYLYLGQKSLALQIIPSSSMPSCPAKNRVVCMANPNDPSCIRAVQARICQETTNEGACTPVPYQTLTSVISLPLTLPTAVTIATAETLGYQTGDVPCP
jgi:hypothetical protein